MSRQSVMSVVAAVVLASVASVSSWAAALPQARQIAGRADGAIVEVIPPDVVVIEAVGVASQLGFFHRRETLQFHSDGTFGGVIEFVAANGDELYCDVAGAFVSNTTATGTYEFTGGTGRFDGVSGQATFIAITPDGVHMSAKFRGYLYF